MGWLVLAAVLLVEAVVVAAAFDATPHNGGDNAAYLTLAHSLVERGAYLELWDPGEPLHTKYPPGFPLVLAGLMVLGARTWAAFKVVPAVAALVSVGMTFLLARQRVGVGLAAGVALLLGLSGSVVYHASLILSDLPFLALTLLALAAFDRADRDVEADGTGERWFRLGAVVAIAAYFTRSAGLPLIVAVLGWLALRRMWRRLGLFSVAFGLPALVWLLRARGVATAGGGEYVSEFWLVDPYQPALGTVGLGGLMGRVVENLRFYVTDVVPQGMAGLDGPSAGVVGIALCALALVGWGGRMVGWRSGGNGAGAAELFFPLYAGLILLWPEVWSGDRFALPLLPLILLYAVEGVSMAFGAFLGGEAEPEAVGPGPEAPGEPVGAPAPAEAFPPGVAGPPRLAVVVLALAGAGLLIPQLRGVLEHRAVAEGCAGVTAELGPFSCYGPGWTEFAAAAHWSGANLPEGSAVFSRKPRIFYLLSGRPSLTFPYSPDPAAFYGLAGEAGITHVLVDRVDVQSSRFVIPVVTTEMSRFCEAMGWTASQGGQTGLLGILVRSGGAAAEPGAEPGAEPETGPLGFSVCGPDRMQLEARPWPDYSSSNAIPLLSPDS
jgi:hypothetical protein